MTDLKYEPVPHDQKAFLEGASKRSGFREAYDALESEYAPQSYMIEELIPVMGLYNSLLNYGYNPQDCENMSGFTYSHYVGDLSDEDVNELLKNLKMLDCGNKKDII